MTLPTRGEPLTAIRPVLAPTSVFAGLAPIVTPRPIIAVAATRDGEQ